MKTSQEWFEIEFINKEKLDIIYDPDGWDRKNFDYSWFEEKITLPEFYDRIARSTCNHRHIDIKRMDKFLAEKK